MRSIKEIYNDRNSYLRRGLSLYSAQLGGFIFCFILLISLAFTLNYSLGRWIMLAALSFAYYITVFACMWDQGYRDSNRVKFGHIKKSYATGFKIGAIGNLFWWVMIASLFLSKLGLCSNILIIFKWLAPPVWPVINMMCDSMYLYNFDWWMMFVILAAGSMIMVISGISYILGYNEIIPLNKLMYTKSKKSKDPKAVSDPRFKN